MTTNLCTLFDSNYLAKGLALIASLEAQQKDYRLWVLALDGAVHSRLQGRDLVSVESLDYLELQTPRLLEARAQRSWQEYCWTLGSVWTSHVMELQSLDSLAYLDADCYLFSSLAPLYSEVREASVAITPHRWTPKYAPRLRVNGLYNVGWVYFKGPRGAECLREWKSQCLDLCQSSNLGGNFADQGYWDELVPKYGVHVVQHLGVNLAPWNVEQYEFALDDATRSRVYVIDRDSQGRISRIDPLLLYHFHEWKPGRRTNYPVPVSVGNWIYEPYESVLRRVL